MQLTERQYCYLTNDNNSRHSFLVFHFTFFLSRKVFVIFSIELCNRRGSALQRKKYIGGLDLPPNDFHVMACFSITTSHTYNYVLQVVFKCLTIHQREY